ncbi:MAG: hypothetical protein AB1427_09215 [Thermodesulfobacteriota bacterium]
MHLYAKIYEFAATVGAFEGYVYGKKDLNPDELSNWVRNIVSAYQHLPPDAKEKFQAPLDGTLGRAARSLAAALGETHEHVVSLKSILSDTSIQSPNDFQFKKWFQK